MNKKRLFTSESVTKGHPDKVCDQISDGVLDAILQQDKDARVACETAVTTGLTLIMGEITTSCYVDIPSIARNVIKSIGYDHSDLGFDGNTCSVLTSIDSQSSDIALGVNKALESKKGLITDSFDTGAGDQGMMFGYACNETKELMPAPITFAHELTRALDKARQDNVIPYLRPDGKSQVSIEYEDGKVKRFDTIVVSTQHNPDIDNATIQDDIINKIILPNLPKKLIDDQTKFFINPTGRFVIGGPVGDSGLTGRKIIVDTYGGYSKHGGGAFSGKDPSKVDRSGAYAARYVAKNIVLAGLADKCEIELAYAIGVAQPVSVIVNTFNTGKISDSDIASIVQKCFDFRPGAIIENLSLKSPIYSPTASYGHFGRLDLNLPWESDALSKEILKQC